MERKVFKVLERWKSSPKRMPLLLGGARQVGKTYTALTFGKHCYKNTKYFNMEDSSEIISIFKRDLDPAQSIDLLFATASLISRRQF